MERLCVELINHFRNFLVVKTVKKSRELIICTDDEFNTIVTSAKQFTLENIIYALDLFQDTLTKIKSGANSRIEMEMSFIKLCEPKLDASQSAVLDRVAQLERAVKSGVTVSAQPPAQKQETQPAPVEEAVQEEPPIFAPTEQSAEEPAPSQIPTQAEEQIAQPQPQVAQEPQTAVQEGVFEFEHWAEFLDIIHKTDIALYGVLNGAGAHFDSGRFVIDSPNPTIKQFIQIPTHLKAIKQAVLELTGQPYKIAVSKPRGESAQRRDALEDLINRAQNNIEVKFE